VNSLEARLASLAGYAHPEGGWGYTPGQAPHLEPTCLALLALAQAPQSHTEVRAKGLAFLRGCGVSGVYRISRGRDEAVWPTALVLFTQAALVAPVAEVRETAAALLALKGKCPDKPQEDIHDINVQLVGWPWADGNFSWAEPTAWACLALRRAGHGDHARVEEGTRLLLDRAFDDGGINYGNRRILGRTTEPIPGPTALMLLAMQGHNHEPRVTAAVNYLLKQALESDDAEHLAWAKLALDVHRDQPGVAEQLPLLDQRLEAAAEARTKIEWLRPAIVREALTILALGAAERSPFRLRLDENAADKGSQVTASPCQLVTPSSPRRGWRDRLSSAFRGMAVDAVGLLRPAPTATAVHIAKATDYNGDLADVLKRQYDTYRAQVPLKGKRVVLKPNLVEYHRDKVINTHPHVVAAVIELCRHEGAAEVIVAEGPGHWRNVEFLVTASGLGDVLRHHRVPFVDLNHDEPVKTPNLGRLTGLDYLFLAQTIATADVVISLPKLKTHHWAGATLSLKNLFGTLPGICYGWPKNELHWRGIDNSIVDIALTRTPDLAIVDGIIGMEGDGPLNGTAKPMGVLVMGCDLMAVDATCCRLMKLDPARIGYLCLGQQKKLGQCIEAAIRQVGERIDELAQPFATVPQWAGVSLAKSA
jgi:uncharacterized protein (DUF362 family)